MEIAPAIERCLERSGPRPTTSAERAAGFQWQTAAESTLAIYREVLGETES